MGLIRNLAGRTGRAEAMSKRAAKWIAAAACCAAIVLLLAALAFGGSEDKGASLSFVNGGLQADGVRIGMTEQELIEWWGPGHYQEAFGGHFRLYSDRQCDIGIPGDRDNDLFGAVGQLEISNPRYGIFGVKSGDSIPGAVKTLNAKGFLTSEHEASILVSGEFTIMLRGQTEVTSIFIGFNDKDLRDRQY